MPLIVMRHTINLFSTKIVIGATIAFFTLISNDLKQLVVEGRWERINTWNVIEKASGVLAAAVIRYIGDDPDNPTCHTPRFMPGRSRMVIQDSTVEPIQVTQEKEA